MCNNNLDLFSNLYKEVASKKIVINSNDITFEAMKNMHWISLTDDQIKQISKSTIINLIDKIITVKLEELLEMNEFKNPMIFYFWFDEQSCRLCFSLVSKSHGVLPFSCKLKISEYPDNIIKNFLNSHYHEGIPINELEECDFDDEDQLSDKALNVWIKPMDI